MPQNGGKPCDKKLSRTQRCKDLPPCPHNFDKSAVNQNTRVLNNNNHHHNHNHHHPNRKGGNGNNNNNKHQSGSKNNDWRITTSTTTTTTGSSMMDDEDDSKFSRSLQAEYGHLQPASFTSSVSATSF